MSTYVYCFTRSSHPLPLEGAVGVGAHGPALRLVREPDLTAVVSDAPPDLRAKRRDLAIHEQVVGRLFAAGTVLPMRFGMVAPSDEALRNDLRSAAQRYGELLSRLEGYVEFNVKGVHDEDAVLRDVLLRNRALRERNEALRIAGGGRHTDKMEFGERIAAAVADLRSRDAERAVALLRPHAVEARRGPPVDGCFVNVSFLVALDARRDFDSALLGLRAELGGSASVHLHGPLPPYSFVRDEAA
jgi:hypothetical protein